MGSVTIYDVEPSCWDQCVTTSSSRVKWPKVGSKCQGGLKFVQQLKAWQCARALAGELSQYDHIDRPCGTGWPALYFSDGTLAEMGPHTVEESDDPFGFLDPPSIHFTAPASKDIFDNDTNVLILDYTGRSVADVDASIHSDVANINGHGCIGACDKLAMPAMSGGGIPLNATTDDVPSFLVDSGASHALIDLKMVVNPEVRVRPAHVQRNVNTANGVIRLDKVVDTMIPSIQEVITAYGRDGTANVLSMGGNSA